MTMLNIACWPFREVQNILNRRKKLKLENKPILFETGYGPSGLPHIGTFGEVFRTTMVRRAFEHITGEKTLLYVFSDDMDGMRKIPSNIPNQELLYQHINKPLTSVPDPFGKYNSFADHNNAMLRQFLDNFGFKYDFKSSTEVYKSGTFNETIVRILEKYDEIMEIMIPSLREERQKTYSPFLPICEKTGQVLQVPIIERNLNKQTIVYLDNNGSKIEVKVTDGHCKLQWKVDWAMRWVALGVDYEMNGKDLVDSLTLSSKICKILGTQPPANLTYELFLDENGFKISKSKGNGITIDDWFKYGNKESLAFYMFQSPTKAKKLHYNIIPHAMNEYLVHLEKFPHQNEKERLENPVWHIHNATPPSIDIFPAGFNMIVNLANIFNTDNPDIIWHCLTKYNNQIQPNLSPAFDEMIIKAIRYYNDVIKVNKECYQFNDMEKQALQELIIVLQSLSEDSSDEEIQTEIYNIGNKYAFSPLRNWFKCLYEILLGQSDGPRFGNLVFMYGIKETAKLIANAINKKD